jgi:hypothetical protein
MRLWSRHGAVRRSVDVLIVSSGVTLGLRAAAEQLADSLRALDYSAEVVFLREDTAWRPPSWLPGAVGELLVAAALRRKTLRALAEMDAGALVYGTSISTIFQPRRLLARAAVSIDQPASVNRPGLRNAPQRVLERRQLARVRLLLPLSRSAADHLRSRYRVPVYPMPLPIAAVWAADGERRRRAVCYVANPEKKGFDIVARAWAAAGIPDADLVVTGIDEADGRAYLASCGVEVPPRLEWRGRLGAEEYRRVVAESMVFLSAARREEYGQALIEALADRALLVALPMMWQIEPVEMARELDPRLTPAERSVEALADAIGVAFAYSDAERVAYESRAQAALRALSLDEWKRRLREDVMPVLLRRDA